MEFEELNRGMKTGNTKGWIGFSTPGEGKIQNGLNHRTHSNHGDFLKHISQPFIWNMMLWRVGCLCWIPSIKMNHILKISGEFSLRNTQWHTRLCLAKSPLPLRKILNFAPPFLQSPWLAWGSTPGKDDDMCIIQSNIPVLLHCTYLSPLGDS